MSFVSKEGDLVTHKNARVGIQSHKAHSKPRFETRVVYAPRPAVVQEYMTAIGDPYRSHGGEYASQFDDLVNYYIRRGWSTVGGVTAMPPAPRSTYERGSGYAAIGLVRNVAWDAPPLVGEHLGEAYVAEETAAAGGAGGGGANAPSVRRNATLAAHGVTVPTGLRPENEERQRDAAYEELLGRWATMTTGARGGAGGPSPSRKRSRRSTRKRNTRRRKN